MSRYARKVDDNQAVIVDALRKLGCVVRSLASVGNGIPDLLVGFRGRLVLLEIKDGAKNASQRALTPAESIFFSEWHQFPVYVVSSQDEAIAAVMGYS